MGGGLAAGMTVAETVVKEAMEEANVPEALAATATSAGSVSFFYRSERGLFPNTEFVFDLELPESFQPGNNDGEVSGFQLTPVKDIASIITSQVNMICHFLSFLSSCLPTGLQDNKCPNCIGLAGTTWSCYFRGGARSA